MSEVWYDAQAAAEAADTTEVWYAAYGQTEEVLPVLLDRPVGPGALATIRNVELCVQEFKQIPPLPRNILSYSWDENFATYALRQAVGAGPADVHVKLFKLTERERRLISEEWNLAHLGWFERAGVQVQLGGGDTLYAVTDVLTHGQDVSRVVTAEIYDVPSLSDPDSLQFAANSVRKLYLDSQPYLDA